MESYAEGGLTKSGTMSSINASVSAPRGASANAAIDSNKGALAIRHLEAPLAIQLLCLLLAAGDQCVAHSIQHCRLDLWRILDEVHAQVNALVKVPHGLIELGRLQVAGRTCLMLENQRIHFEKRRAMQNFMACSA